MQAVIMAGGAGTRLAPYTAVLPKPLMPLNDRPILAVVLEQLTRAGIRDITISVGHLSELIETWVRHHTEFEAQVTFAYEQTPLGTAGALGNMPRSDSTFVSLMGDVLTTLDFKELIAAHRESGAIATVAINERMVDVPYGVVRTDERGRITHLEEKPTLRYPVSMGIYALEPEIADLMAPGERVDFPDLLQRAMASGHEVHTYPFAGYWRDIGNREDYEQAVDDFAADPSRFVATADTGPSADRR